ncbi:Sphingolipid C4-hydroxylase sur2 [Savitreella phatthalungensis]
MWATRNTTATYTSADYGDQWKPRPLMPFMEDATLALVAPVIVYWTMSLLFHWLDASDSFASRRIHTPLELRSRNKVTLHKVIRDVILQQLVQTMVGAGLSYFDKEVYHNPQITVDQVLNLVPVTISDKAARGIAFMLLPAMRFLGAIFILDTWQYWLHRAMHTNKFLYRHFHSHHHRLYVPYAFGALYNHPLEGLMLDTVGAGLGYLLTGMTTRESVFFYAFSTAKTVDDHCGYLLPFDPLQIFFSNNARYHDIHHQSYGIKKNFSQPYFTFWDKLCGTYMDPMETPRALRLAKEANGTAKISAASVDEKTSTTSVIGVNGTKGARQGKGPKTEGARRRTVIGDEQKQYNTSVFTKDEEKALLRGETIAM